MSRAGIKYDMDFPDYAFEYKFLSFKGQKKIIFRKNKQTKILIVKHTSNEA